MDVKKIDSFSLGADLWSSKDLRKSILGIIIIITVAQDPPPHQREMMPFIRERKDRIL